MTDVAIVAAARTAVGSFNGAFGALPAHELGKVAIKAALDRAGLQPGDITEVVLGQVLTAGQGQNPARQASIAAGIPVDAPAWSINQVCGSGLRAVALGAREARGRWGIGLDDGDGGLDCVFIALLQNPLAEVPAQAPREREPLSEDVRLLLDVAALAGDLERCDHFEVKVHQIGRAHV